MTKKETQNLVAPVTDRQAVRLKTLIQTCNCLRSTFVWLLSKPKISRTVHAYQLLTLLDKVIWVLQNGKFLYSRVCHIACFVPFCIKCNVL